MVNGSEGSQALRLYNALHSSGEVRSYSGRGMYGEYCVATTETPPARAIEIAGWPRTDSLGMGQIYYWPACKWDEEIMQESD